MSRPIPDWYFRSTIAHPDGSVCHDGDCHVFDQPHICTCGLLHHLSREASPESLFSDYHRQHAEHAFYQLRRIHLEPYREPTPEESAQLVAFMEKTLRESQIKDDHDDSR